MNAEVILSEMYSPATKEIMAGLCKTIDKLEEKEISYQEGAVELAGYKHTIQDLALDWMYGRKSRKIKQIASKVK